MTLTKSLRKKILLSSLGVTLCLGIGIAIPKLTVHDVTSLSAQERTCIETGIRQQFENPLRRFALMLGKSAVVEKVPGQNTMVVRSYTLYRIPLGATHFFNVANEQTVVVCDWTGGDDEVLPNSQTLTPVTLTNGERIDFLGTFHDSASVDSLKSYTSDKLGVLVKYPESYLLFENEPAQEDQTGVYQNFQTIVIGPKEPILQTIARARAGFAGEGPYTITLSFFYVPEIRNRETNLAPLDYLKQWLAEHQGQSNFYPEGQGPSTTPAALTPTTIAKVPAFRYRNEYGMYESDNIALVHDDRIVILSAPTDSSIHGDFETMLSNLQLSI